MEPTTAASVKPFEGWEYRSAAYEARKLRNVLRAVERWHRYIDSGQYHDPTVRPPWNPSRDTVKRAYGTASHIRRLLHLSEDLRTGRLDEWHNTLAAFAQVEPF
jgi:hypothetical protein